jgi:anti-sigma factor (TIGR02949 family)
VTAGADWAGAFGCAEVDRFVDAYLDGEFAEEDRAELERHVAGCAACTRKVRFQAAFKSGLQAAAPRPALPEGMRARIVEQLRHERAPVGRWRRVALRAVPAAAAAAAIVAVIGTSHRFSPVAADAISRHARGLPVEVTGPEDAVRAWFAQKVDFAVRPPQIPHAALVGARLANIRDRQAAYFIYNTGGAKVSVFVFDPRDLPLEARRHRIAGDHDIYLDGDRGYHVALWRDRGLGYAVASDLDEEQMFQLASHAVGR